MENKIRGAVFSKFPSILAFAKAIGWNRRKAAKIVNGTQRPNAEEMEAMAKQLGIDNAEDFMDIFFPNEYAK